MLCPLHRRFSFPVLHSFLHFSVVSFKVHGWLPISECAEVTFLHGSAFGRPSSLSFFSNEWNPTLPVWKSFIATPLFIPLHSGSPRCHPLALWEVAPSFLLFLLDHLVLEKDVPILRFLCSFFGFFLWAVLIISWLYYTPRGSRAFWQFLRIPTQLSFYAGNSSIF